MSDISETDREAALYDAWSAGLSREEAIRVVNRAECATVGHDFAVVVAMGSKGPDAVLCRRCGGRWICLGQDEARP